MLYLIYEQKILLEKVINVAPNWFERSTIYMLCKIAVDVYTMKDMHTYDRANDY